MRKPLPVLIACCYSAESPVFVFLSQLGNESHNAACSCVALVS